ncbi:MAG TPA: ATP-binding protein [Polyangiaceae bacterium]|nr:ATP-binding protein [Polyangiaceae bacterium]
MGFGRSVWRRLTQPSPAIQDPVRGGSARLLAACLILTVCLFGLLDGYLSWLTPGYRPPFGGYACLLVSYGLSRTRFYKVGALIATLMFTLVAVLLVVAGGTLGPLVFASAAPVFAGIFLGFRSVVIVGALSPLAVGLVPWLTDGRYSFGDVIEPVVGAIVSGVVAALYIGHRDWVEQQRSSAAEAREAQFQQMQKMEALGRLAGGIAHDFNNLLTVIAGGVELLQRKGGGKEVTLIDSATRSARDLTQQLLTLSRQGLVEHGSSDIAEVMQGLRDLLVRIIGEDIDVVVDVVPGTPAVALSPSRMQQVLLNLATNARDAMPRGGTLRLAAFPERTGVRIVVSDTGQGMDEAVRRRAFEPFFTTKEVGKGTGLGLAMVFGIVTQATGTVTIESEAGRGTTFRIWLPCADEPVELAVSERRIPITRAESCILLVEDSQPVRQLCERVLTEAGYKVIPAASPSDALDLFERNFKRIDLVVSDLVMPVLSGTEMVRAFRRRVPTLPVLFMSGYAPEDMAIEPVDVRFLLQKPFRPADLLRAVGSVLAGDASGWAGGQPVEGA